MPGNVKTELPLFPQTEMAHFVEPYNKWAPEPFSQLPGPRAPGGGEIFGKESNSPVMRIRLIMIGIENMFEEAFGYVLSGEKGPDMIEKSFKFTKTKVGSNPRC